jgi:hypothetical protein
MFCQKCGSENQIDAQFCMKCGTNLVVRQSSSSTTNVYYWALSLMPLSIGVAGIALGTALESSAAYLISAVISVFANIALVIADSNELKKSGLEISVWMGFLLIPVYLYRRAKLLGSPQIGLIVWTSALAVSFLVDSVASSSVGSMESTDQVESSITSWLLENDYVASDVIVECPDTVLSKPQATFLCNVTSSLDEIVLQVTVENEAGDVTWQVVG